MVSSKPYYQEEEQPGSYSWEDFVEMRNMGNESQIGETNPFMLLGPGPKKFSSYPRRPPPPGIKCFKCTGDHWARDCPQAPTGPPRPRFPPIERHCVKCCGEHFPKDCPQKTMANLPPNQPTIGLKLIDVITSPVWFEHENERISLQVITRAQATKGAVVEGVTESSTQKKKRRQRKLRSSQSKKSKVANAATNAIAQEEGRDAEVITDKQPRALSMPRLG